MKRSINGYMYGNLNENLHMTFSYMDKIRWNVLVLNTTISFTVDDKWEEKRDELNLGPESGWASVNISWGGNNTVYDCYGHHFLNSVTLPTAAAYTLDMVAEVAGAFLISVEDYDQYGVMAKYTVIDDGTYVPPTTKSKASSEAMSSGAIAGLSVAMCLVAVALIAILFVIRRRRGEQYARALDDSSTIVFNPVVPNAGDSSHDKAAPKCAWCNGPHSAQDCKQMMEFANKRRAKAAETRDTAKVDQEELMHMENI